MFVCDHLLEIHFEENFLFKTLLPLHAILATVPPPFLFHPFSFPSYASIVPSPNDIAVYETGESSIFRKDWKNWGFCRQKLGFLPKKKKIAKNFSHWRLTFRNLTLFTLPFLALNFLFLFARTPRNTPPKVYPIFTAKENPFQTKTQPFEVG